MSKFRANKTISRTPIGDKRKVDDVVLQAFAKGENLNIDDAATQSFTVPINEHHLGMLRLLKDKEKRSQRKIAERLLARAIREEWEFYNVKPE